MAPDPSTFFASLDDARREAVEQLHQVIEAHLPEGFVLDSEAEILSWVVPLERYPEGYLGDASRPLPFLSYASRKSAVVLYHMGLYLDADLAAWFRGEYPNHVSTKLDMGKNCVRLKKIDQIPYALIADLCARVSVESWIALYESSRA